MTTELRRRLHDQIKLAQQGGVFRSLRHLGESVDFCSNDYLGIARRSTTGESAAEYRVQPSGATGSRLISGNSPLAEELEGEIAQFHGASTALLFSSGYMANLALVASLTGRHDTIIYDELAHASLRDGIRLSHSRALSFRHNDVEDLRKKLKLSGGAKMIVVESIYSMDGDRAPLNDIIGTAAEFGAEVVVDEAHSVGIDGEDGRGLVHSLGLQDAVLARTMTFGKALGCHGAAIVSDRLVKESLINFGRSFIFSTAASPRSLIDIRDAYRELRQLGSERKHLATLSERLAELLPESRVGKNEWTPIHRLVIPGNRQVLAAADALNALGFAVIAIRSPTVKSGSERVRICLHSFNTVEQVERLAEALKKFCPQECAEAV